MAAITTQVGGGHAKSIDVMVVQGALNRVSAARGGPVAPLATTGLEGTTFTGAIQVFQRSFFGAFKPDGKVDAGGKTWQALAGTLHVKWIGVFLDEQVVRSFSDGAVVDKFDCVTGDGSNPTNPGQFSIKSKDRLHTSRQFGVKMDFAQFFDGGKALHQYHGIVPLAVIRILKSGTDFFGSHGCVRLVQSDADTLFKFGVVGMRVTVIK
jgi:hypothetical protein